MQLPATIVNEGKEHVLTWDGPACAGLMSFVNTNPEARVLYYIQGSRRIWAKVFGIIKQFGFIWARNSWESYLEMSVIDLEGWSPAPSTGDRYITVNENKFAFSPRNHCISTKG
jgi:hypothetical protein